MLLRKRTSGLSTKVLGDELVILDIQSGQIHQLNATAAFIWNVCEDVGSEAELVARYTEAFGSAPEVALSDILETVRTLRALNLLQEIRRHDEQ